MVSFSLLVGLVFATHACALPTSTLESNVPSTESILSKEVIVQMFQWSWDSVAQECHDFLGPAGYDSVQVGPPQEAIQGDQWYIDYQVVTYNITSTHGTRDQFQSMIETCHAAGVKVIVDTLWNHMAALDGGLGYAGSNFSHFNYPGIYNYSNFHHCSEPNGQIDTYNSTLITWTCMLSNLADLRTETEYVRQNLADYSNDLLSMGVDGFRLDAAKHMNPVDIRAILNMLDHETFVTQEVQWGPGDAVTTNMYLETGNVQEFRFAAALQNDFLNGTIYQLPNIRDGKPGWVPSDKATSFVATHDTERSNASLVASSPNNAFVLASIFNLAFPYGEPTVISSYPFTDTDAGGPNGGVGTCSENGGANGWYCQHRWQAIRGMVGFRNNVAKATPVTKVYTPRNETLAFERDGLGYVAINDGNNDWTDTFPNGLPDGLYCDVVHGEFNLVGQNCTGPSYTNENGIFRAHINPWDAVAIHTGAMLSPLGTAAYASSQAKGRVPAVVPSVLPAGIPYTPGPTSVVNIAVGDATHVVVPPPRRTVG